MKVGDMDGWDQIYQVVGIEESDSPFIELAGVFLSRTNEKILKVHTEVLVTLLKSHVHGYNNAHKFPSACGEYIDFCPEAGWFNLYITNERMVFLRHPDTAQIYALLNLSPQDTITGAPKQLFNRVEYLTEKGALEYIEILYNDIESYRYDGNRLMADLKLSGSDSYSLELYGPTATSADSVLSKMPNPPNRIKSRLNWVGRLFAYFFVAEALLLLGALYYGTFFASAFSIILVAITLLAIINKLNSSGANLLKKYKDTVKESWKHPPRYVRKKYGFKRNPFPSKYNCPNCGSVVDRVDIACRGCKAIVYWSLGSREFKKRPQ